MRASILFILALLAAMPAHALSIRNLTDTTQVVVMEQGGQRFEMILPPKTTRYYQGGDVTLHKVGQPPIRADFMNEYAIWPDGKLIIQRRQKVKGISR